MRKLSFEQNLRHRLRDAGRHIPGLRIREERPRAEGLVYLAIGAVAGLAAGAVLAQKYGGFGAVTSKLRDRFGEGGGEHEAPGRYHGEEYDEYEYNDEEDEYAALSTMEELEERVLEAYHNDPVLSERAIDIGAIDEGIIELTGWVHSAEESAHAVTVARGTPGVETVVNRLAVRVEEDGYSERARRFREEDDALTEARWEGKQVGTGRQRQGTSQDPGRHDDPKVPLEERWLDTDEAYRNAADSMEGLAERRRGKGASQGDRAGGGPVTPTGVPKGDHVANPLEAPQSQETGETEAPRGD